MNKSQLYTYYMADASGLLNSTDKLYNTVIDEIIEKAQEEYLQVIDLTDIEEAFAKHGITFSTLRKGSKEHFYNMLNKRLSYT